MEQIYFWLSVISVPVVGLLVWLLFRERKRYEKKVATLQKNIDEDSVFWFAKQSEDPETIKLVHNLENKLKEHGISLKNNDKR